MVNDGHDIEWWSAGKATIRLAETIGKHGNLGLPRALLDHAWSFRIRTCDKLQVIKQTQLSIHSHESWSTSTICYQPWLKSFTIHHDVFSTGNNEPPTTRHLKERYRQQWDRGYVLNQLVRSERRQRYRMVDQNHQISHGCWLLLVKIVMFICNTYWLINKGSFKEKH